MSCLRIWFFIMKQYDDLLVGYKATMATIIKDDFPILDF